MADGVVSSEVNTKDKEYKVLMDAAHTHMNAAQAYFEAARQLMMVGPEEDKMDPMVYN